MDDDFNTPEAIAVLFEIAREINRRRDSDPEKSASLAGCLAALGNILGLLQADPESYFRESAAVQDAATPVLTEAGIEDLLARRITAREAKDWAEADRIRDELDAAGVVIEDGPAGTTWRRK
jgi:cysteinyl-tRNA synthetase